MKTKATMLLFKEASDAYPSIDGKPTNDNLLAIWEHLLPILMLIPYDQLTAVHFLTSLIINTGSYRADQGNVAFP